MLDLLTPKRRARSAGFMSLWAKSWLSCCVLLIKVIVAQQATYVKRLSLRIALTPIEPSVAINATVAVARIHRGKTPRRPHFIPEWAETRGLKPADLARELGADKSVVSRWYHGASPSQEWQAGLAALFACEPDALFRHPDDDWLSRFLQGRQLDEIQRIKATLEAAFPKKAS
jgi:hypothetical protein